MIDFGDVVTLTWTVTNAAGNKVDPDDVTATITLPDGTTDDATVTKFGTGIYNAVYTTVQAGRHIVNWVGTGSDGGAYADVFDVAPAAVTGLISLADAKEQLNTTTTDHDEEIRSYIEAATRVVEGHVGAVVRRTETATVNGSGVTLVLPVTPVISVTSVVESDTTLTADDYVVDTVNGLVTRVSSGFPFPWLPGVGNITVTYVAGRPVVPANFLLAARIIIQHLWDTQRGSSNLSVQFAGNTGGVDIGGDAVVQAGYGFSIPRRAVELLEHDLDVGGVA